jgi:hypothetical protein
VVNDASWRRSLGAVMAAVVLPLLASQPSPGANFRQFIDAHCADCHYGEDAEAGLDLSRFPDEAAVMKHRAVWRLVYDKVESRQMPPPKQESQPTDAERTAMLEWIEDIASRPDPLLGARDPGRPVLRRLTRLEYNNAIRDLFGLDIDVFMFPERLPITDKAYFQPASGRMTEPVQIAMREYGQKYQVLCPTAGLPGDNRAEHGFRNRGDAMDFSPLLLEKFLASAREITHAPDLPVLSDVAAELFGIDPQARQKLAAKRKGNQAGLQRELSLASAHEFAPNVAVANPAGDGALGDPKRFRQALDRGIAQGIGGVFDGGETISGPGLVPGKGGALRLTFAGGAKCLVIKPSEDLWLVGFSSAKPTSGTKLFCNRIQDKKQFELTFDIEDGDADEGIERLAVCVLGRSQESGTVALTARCTDDTEATLKVDVTEGPDGTRFVEFTSVPGESIKSLVVDGTDYSGGYVLLDDLAFITSGRPKPAKAFGKVAAQSPVAGEPDADAGPRSPKGPATEAVAGDAKPRLSPQERLKAFVAKAFRRAVTDSDVQPFFAMYETACKGGTSEQDAMREAVAGVLASPQFLFVEANGMADGGSVARLEDTELATRLALFLWASTPDDRLLALANAGRLHDPDVLEQETRRMLRDPRSRELSESFAVQWLRLDQLYTAKPDRDLFKAFYSGPQGKQTLHGAVLAEALLLFETVQVEDRSILDFISADYSWLNADLAKLYGMPLAGDDTEAAVAAVDTTRELRTKEKNLGWRRVSLSDGQRGGFITMAAPLVVTSLPFRTSPVKRGAWLLETIFHRPPTEPKVAFTIENDTKEAAQQMSIRQKFEAHRTSEACYSCHVRLDPPGFALERFSPIGQWRDADGNQPVDAKGDWQGKPFDGPAEFKAILAENPHEFTRGFIEHLLSYALGRELQVYDMPTVAEIQRAAEADGWRFSRIVVEIVKSYPFTHVRRDVGQN